MSQIRPLLHDVLNSLAIARGLSETVEATLKGELELTPEQQLDKITRAILAMDKVENFITEIREIVLQTEGE